MSIKLMTAIWEHSRAKGSELLLLIAIADHADDEGNAFPSVTNLAKKIRMTQRGTQMLLRKLEKLHELSTELECGPNGRNLYRVKTFQGHKRADEPGVTPGDEPQFTTGMNPSSPKPSLESSEDLKEELSSTILYRTGASAIPQVVNGDQEVATLPTKKGKKTKEVKPLPEDDWLKALLLEYADSFDVTALDDDAWWTDTGNSFPTFTRAWVSMAFASLARWLRDNPKRKPRVARYWKARMNFSLNWYYDKHIGRV